MNRLLARTPNRIYALLALSVFGLASCASNAPNAEPPEATDTPTVPMVAQSAATPTPSAKPSSAAQTAIKKYFDALGTNDADEQSAAVALAAPGSLAAAYIAHQAAVAGAQEDGGTSNDAETVEVNGSGYMSCADDVASDDDCTKFGDLQMRGGRLANFTVNKKKIDGRLSLGQGDKIQAGKLATVEFVSAYRTAVSETLYVTLLVRSLSKDIDLSLYSATYRDPSGRQIQADDAIGLIELEKDSNTRASVMFKKGKTGGVVTLPIANSKTYATVDVKIKVG